MSLEQKPPQPEMLVDLPAWCRKFGGDLTPELHREKHQQIYAALVDILGERFVSDDPAMFEAYARERQTSTIFSKGRSEFVVLPGSAQDIQEIIRLSNRLKFPWSIMSAGMIGFCFAAQGIPFWCQIDPKRMTRLEIDEKNMYAIVEPYVTNVQVQAEAMQRGLYCGIPSAGGQSTAMGNHLYVGVQSTCYRTGFTAKNILGVEWVLPNGEMVRTGSLANPEASWFWGEGPGPDSRAVLRGMMGNLGSLGVVTRMAIKLFPWPGPADWPVEGTPPFTKVVLPHERFRFFCFTFAELEQSLKCMVEIAKCEIGALVHRNGIYQIRNFCNKSREEYWQKYLEGYWEKHLGAGVANHMMVGIFGWASPKQADYEEMIIKEIVSEYGGTWIEGPALDEIMECVATDAIRTQACTLSCRLGLGPGLSAGSMDGMKFVPQNFRFMKDLIKKYTPPHIDMGPSDWVAPIDMGHYASTEIYGPNPERSEKTELEIEPRMFELFEGMVKDGTVGLAQVYIPQQVVGPFYENFQSITGRIKQMLDPNSVGNPTRLIDMVEIEKAEKKAG